LDSPPTPLFFEKRGVEKSKEKIPL